MSNSDSWENKCCRCEGDTKADLHPGKRACHLTCGPCLYPEGWDKCNSCETVGHCMYALNYLKGLHSSSVRKGCYFTEQLTGEESLYHVESFVNAQQQLVNALGEEEYLEYLKKANAENGCTKK